MPVSFTRHGLQQASSRDITLDEIVAALASPDSTINGMGGKFIAQKRAGDQLLRVVHRFDEQGDIIVITVYKTSKVAKYST
ncbi:MAG TPA: DUF4258 domain-containing protein [Candidatus Lokiarchaeia archaeon]|nr:DUF4258 domain-containing protein [Candidatus Lokiarchaeia archaeon]